MDLQNSLLQWVPDAVIVIDRSGHIVYANTRCESLLGYAPAELVGEPIEKLVPARFASHVQVRDKFMRAPSLRQMGAGLELVARHKNGDELAVDISLRPVDMDGAQHVVAAIRDVREQRALLQQTKLQSIALEAAASGVMITSKEGIISYANAAACEMSGYGADELVGQPAKLLKSGLHPPEFFQDLWSTILAGRIWHGTLVNRHKSGSFYDEEQTIAPVRSGRGDITHFVAIRQNISERVKAERELRQTRDELARRVAEVEELHEQLRAQSIRDTLTGLFNRRYLDETLPREIALAQRQGAPLMLAVLDLDHFKRVNDDHGHAIGDRVLAAIGEVLRTRSRAGDIACRFGGEEFVVLLVGASPEGAQQRAEEWRRSFARVETPAGKDTVRATVSIGLATLGAEESAQSLFSRADAALYEAKHTGRDRVVLAREDATHASDPDRAERLGRARRRSDS